jgi:hypothetical protein
MIKILVTRRWYQHVVQRRRPGRGGDRHDADEIQRLRPGRQGGLEQRERRLQLSLHPVAQRCLLRPKRLVIESWWVSEAPALAGELRPRRLNN